MHCDDSPSAENTFPSAIGGVLHTRPEWIYVYLVQEAGGTARDVVIAGHSLKFSFFHQTGYHSGGFAQKSCLDLGIRLGCGLEIGARLIDSRLNMRIKSADLPWNFLRLNRCLHRTPTSVAHHKNHLLP